MFCPDQALQPEENKAPTIHGTFELNTKLAFIKIDSTQIEQK